MVILGIDPGSRIAGHGLIEIQGNKLTYLASGVLRYNPNTPFIDKLGDIYQSCQKLVQQTRPDEIAIESLIHVKNVNSLAKLSQARGAMLACFAQTHKSKVFEYGPNLIKSAVTGYGHADKAAVIKTLGMILGTDLKRHDESDALAAAVCHALTRPRHLAQQEVTV